MNQNISAVGIHSNRWQPFGELEIVYQGDCKYLINM